LALVALVAVCFVFAGRAHLAPSHAVGPSRAAGGFAAFMLAAQAVIYTYDGWSGPIYFSEELNDPGRQIPRSMFYGLGLVAAIYLLINIAFVRALPTPAMAGAPLAAASVAKAIFGGRGELIASRTLYGMSRDGLGFPWATRVSRGGTPTASMVLSGLVTIGFLATGTFETIIAIAAFFFVADYAVSFLAVFILRRREPSAARPYRAVGHPWTTGFVLLGSLAFLASAVVGDRRNSLAALGILVVSYPAFRLSRPFSAAGVVALPGGSVDPYVSGDS